MCSFDQSPSLGCTHRKPLMEHQNTIAFLGTYFDHLPTSKNIFFLQISGSSGKLYGIHIQFFCIKTMVFMVFAAKPPETDGSPDPNGPSDFDRSAQRPHAPRCLRCAPDSSAMSGETA